ncbi:basic helix-loop-helix protein [Podochytrium sp. JEL0797]|nr:basic helix-loop-helix protein [Podochytrium sp. JEL0797]
MDYPPHDAYGYDAPFDHHDSHALQTGQLLPPPPPPQHGGSHEEMLAAYFFQEMAHHDAHHSSLHHLHQPPHDYAHHQQQHEYSLHQNNHYPSHHTLEDIPGSSSSSAAVTVTSSAPARPARGLKRKTTEPAPAAASTESIDPEKRSHKEIERRRREIINLGIRELAAIVPNAGGQKKGKVIELAIDHLAHLQTAETENLEKWVLEKALLDDQIGRLRMQENDLRRANEALKREIESLERS